MKINKRNAIIIRDVCYDHLIKEGQKRNVHITVKMIESYFKIKKVTTLAGANGVFEHLVSTIQNYNRMPKVIKFYEGLNYKFFMDFNHISVLKKYETEIEVWKAAQKSNPLIVKDNRSWKQYSRGVLDSARWLSQFRDFNEFQNYLKVYEEGGLTGVKFLVRSLSRNRIAGMGPAIAYNFIKDLGLPISYLCAKPDVYIKNMLSGLNICGLRPSR